MIPAVAAIRWWVINIQSTWTIVTTGNGRGMNFNSPLLLVMIHSFKLVLKSWKTWVLTGDH